MATWGRGQMLLYQLKKHKTSPLKPVVRIEIDLVEMVTDHPQK